jgi:enterochelin esterase-like enzyme
MSSKWRAVVTSPWFEQATAALAEDPSDSVRLESFWNAVGALGTPVIEADPEHTDSALVTFLWRMSGERGELPVALAGGLVISEFADYTLHELGGTDILHLTLRLPRGLRTSYLFAVGDSLAPFDPFAATENRTVAWCPDPLNRNVWVSSAGHGESRGAGVAFSQLEIDAEALRYAQRPQEFPDPPVETFTMNSTHLNEPRRLWIWRPGGGTARARKRIWMLDGWDAVSSMPVPTILDRWRADGGETLEAVFIDSGNLMQRQRDLLFSDEFVRFIEREAAPLVDEVLGSKRPEDTVISGMSAGGGMALYLGLRAPQLFGNVLAQSSACAYFPRGAATGWLANQFRLHPPIGSKVYLSVGTIELDRVWDIPPLLAANVEFAAMLKALGVESRLDEIHCGHDLIPYRENLVTGLMWLFC